MPNRAARIASAVFASVLVSASLTAIQRSAAGTDDECLSAPKGDTPQGSHWYYKFDRASKRQCWYLRDEGEAAANAAPLKLTPPARPASAAMQPTMADARAELPLRPRNAAPNREDRPAATIAANAPLSEADKVLQPPVAESQSAVAASRWPSQPNAFAAANPSVSPAPAAGPAPDNANADASTAALGQMPPPPTAGPFVAPDLPPETRTHSVQMLLAAILGALALAGVMARLIFNFVGTRRRSRRKARARRGAIWKSAAPARRKQAIYLGAAKPPQPHSPRDLDQVGDPDDRIAELLRDFSRKTRAANRRQSGVGSLL
jgi:hypothetical protein